MEEFISQHSVRLLAVVAAAVPVLTALYPKAPWGALAGLVGTLLRAGEAAQRHEDLKTRSARASRRRAVDTFLFPQKGLQHATSSLR